MLLPTNVSDPGAMIAQAVSIYKKASQVQENNNNKKTDEKDHVVDEKIDDKNKKGVKVIEKKEKFSLSKK